MAELFSDTQQNIADIRGDLRELHGQYDYLKQDISKITGLLERLVQSEIELKVAITDHHSTFDRLFSENEKSKERIRELEKLIDNNHDEINEWKNKVQGGWKVLNVLWAVFGAMLSSSALWMFTEVMDMRDRVNIHQHIVIEYMREKHRDKLP